MGLLPLLFKDPLTFVLVAIPLLYSIILHEVAHGWVADKMGDSTARWLGRLTLNPIRHLDPIGTAMLFIFGFGWAKPVPVNFNNLRPERRGLIFVASAGIVTNILLAFIAALLLHYMAATGMDAIYILLQYMFQINVMLAAFNLIPIPPLDGSKILMGFASRKFQYTMARIEPYGFFIILAALWLGFLNPLIYFIQQIIKGAILLFLP
ncbi:MAG TPA: site-2 protease family protein [Syntrophorhabdaceae bacterium]|jgi:Zn-dependent protease